MKRLDLYIIKKFLGTFFFSIVLILSIAIVFDLTEKMDDFFENQVPLKEIILDYYMPFIPYYAQRNHSGLLYAVYSVLHEYVQFAVHLHLRHLFYEHIFISVIYFTSKLAGNSEIIAMQAAGMSYHRLMLPYALSAALLFVLGVLLGGWVIPRSSERMLHFTDKYIEHFTSENARNMQFEVRIYYDSLYCWHLDNYVQRTFDDMRETLERGSRKDIELPITPDELFITAQQAQQMTTPELRHYMQRQRERGSGNVKAFEVEYHKRWASPLGAFIMTLLGVTMSSRRVRGGMGKNLGLGVILTAGYILFSTVSTTFSVNNIMSPFMAAWLPNFVFLALSIPLYIRASK